MIRAAVTGAMGRMGQRIIHLLQEEEGICLGGALEKPGHPKAGMDAGDLSGIGKVGVPLSTELGAVLEGCDVIIDFTFPEISLNNIREASAAGKPMVIGTTGFSEKEIESLRSFSSKVPNLFAPNMSLGVNLLLKLLPEVARTLGKDFDVEIVEAHHHFKKDAPSGTAVRMAEVIASALDLDPEKSCVHGRCGKVGDRGRNEIGVHAVRGGDIVGEHTVMFCGAGERLEFVHKAGSRDTFAKGAIRAARWIVSQKPGLYSMIDMLGI